MSINDFTDDQALSVVKATSRISSRGQIVIPMEIRKRLGIGEGDHLTFIAEQNGEVKVEAVKSTRITEYFGILRSDPGGWLTSGRPSLEHLSIIIQKSFNRNIFI